MKTVSYTDVLYRAAELAGRPRDKLPVSEARMIQGYFAVDLQGVWNSQAWPELIPDFLSPPIDSQRRFSKFQELGAETIAATVSTDGTALAVVTCSTAHGMVSGDMVTLTGAAHAVFNVTNAVATVTDTTHFSFVIPAQGGAFGDACTVSVNVEIGDVLCVLTNNPHVTTRLRGVEFQEGNGYVWVLENIASVWVEYMLPRPDLMSIPDNALAAATIPSIFSNYLALRAAGHLLRSDSQTASGDEMLALAETTLGAEIRRLPPPPWWRNVSVRGSFGSRPMSNSQMIG